MAKQQRDVEAQKQSPPPAHIPHWKLVIDPAGVDEAALQWNYRGEGNGTSPFIVDFLPNDPHNPFKFPKWKRWMITLIQAFAALGVTFVSTAYSADLSEILETFHISEEISILGISLFVLGFAIGPLLWAPASGKAESISMIPIIAHALSSMGDTIDPWAHH